MINYFTAPFKWFFKLEAASGLILLIAAVIALILSNSNLSTYYFNVLEEMYENKLKFENLFKDKEKALNQSSAFVSTKTCSCYRAPFDDGTEIKCHAKYLYVKKGMNI